MLHQDKLLGAWAIAELHVRNVTDVCPGVRGLYLGIALVTCNAKKE